MCQKVDIPGLDKVLVSQGTSFKDQSNLANHQCSDLKKKKTLPEHTEKPLHIQSLLLEELTIVN